MKTEKIDISFAQAAAAYRIQNGHGSMAGAGNWARRCLGKNTKRIVLVSNPTVFDLYGATAVEQLSAAGFDVTVWLMKDGERYKNMRSLELALTAFGEAGLTRTDAVAALGGGVVGDLAGFAASVYLRGIAFLQMPTTLLSMIDSSVGGKTGVNSDAGKNTIGAFYQPRGVIIDTATLATLPKRELTAGFCEAIKQGAIGGRRLLEQTDAVLKSPDTISGLIDMIAAHLEFKAAIVAGDERESTARTDGRSRKILNFGHTLAHALEKATDYRYFKHGEAVGYGILYAAEVSKKLALLDKKSVNLLYDVVHRAGILPPLDKIDLQRVFEAFRFDKKNISGSLQMVLLKDIGKPVLVGSKDIPQSVMKDALKKLV